MTPYRLSSIPRRLPSMVWFLASLISNSCELKSSLVMYLITIMFLGWRPLKSIISLPSYNSECIHGLASLAKGHGIDVLGFEVMDRRLEGALGKDLEKQVWFGIFISNQKG